MKKILLNAIGVSLVESLFGLGLLGVAGYGAMSLSDMQKKSVMEGGGYLDRNVSFIKENLNDPRTCDQNFKGKKVNADVSLEELVNAKGEVFLKKNGKTHDGSYVVESIIIGQHRPEILRTDVKFRFRRAMDGGNSKIEEKTVRVLTKAALKDGETVITECIDLSLASLSELIKQLCIDADPEDIGDCDKNYKNLLAEVKELYCNDPARPYLKWDANTKRCLPIDAKVGCPSGLMRGYVNGVPDCYVPTVPPAIVNPPIVASPSDCVVTYPRSWTVVNSLGKTRICTAASGPATIAENSSIKLNGTGPYDFDKGLMPTRGSVTLACAGGNITESASSCIADCTFQCAGLFPNTPFVWKGPAMSSPTCKCVGGKTETVLHNSSDTYTGIGLWESANGSISVSCLDGDPTYYDKQCDVGGFD